MVAATAVAVQAIDEAYSHFSEGVRGNLVDVPSKIASWAVVVAADAEARGGGVGGFG